MCIYVFFFFLGLVYSWVLISNCTRVKHHIRTAILRYCADVENGNDDRGETARWSYSLMDCSTRQNIIFFTYCAIKFAEMAKCQLDPLRKLAALDALMANSQERDLRTLLTLCPSSAHQTRLLCVAALSLTAPMTPALVAAVQVAKSLLSTATVIATMVSIRLAPRLPSP